MKAALTCCTLVVALLILGSAPGMAERSWTEEKCLRYGRDWTEAIRRFGTEGVSPAFLERHRTFIASGCSGPRDVCPTTAKDFDLANILTIRAMNFGAASTFLPFSCAPQK